MIHPERVQPLNRRPPARGRYVLYWMQASQRADCNHALEYAARQADSLSVPLVVGFGLTADYPEANARHYAFLLEGLHRTARDLADRGIRLVARLGGPSEVALDLADDAALLIADCGYLRHQRTWRRTVARRAPCRVVQVETDVLVPTAVASDHEEYAARTLRPKHRRHWEEYLVDVEQAGPRRDSIDLRLDGLELGEPAEVLERLDVDRGVPPSCRYRGGADRARRRLHEFVASRLPLYAEHRNDPAGEIQSDMSPYLHFGQISPLRIALAVRDADAPAPCKDAYLEELLVRRELGVNFVLHNARYDTWAGLPGWARGTLDAHADDTRPAVYRLADLEAGETGDPYWNAAMREMRLTGKMHGYMRMYWGKRIIEWTRSPRTAFRWIRRLDNRWFLDGRDPLSYSNVAWCFGRHDQPWPERPVFGKVRSMSAAGLERKFDMPAYLRRVEAMEE